MRPAKSERDASFAEFMDQAGPALLRTAWFLTGDTDHAQELTQAALVKTYVVWHKVDHDRALAYARRCLVNHKIDVWRATRREVVADLSGGGPELSSASRSRAYNNADATTDHRDDLVRRMIAMVSAAMAVALMAAGATLLTRPHDSAAPRPATRTATTGIVLAQTGHLWGGQSEVRFNRDAAVQSNVRYSIVGKDGRRNEPGVSSTVKPGQKPTASWKSAMVDGHPVTIGVYPGRIGDALTLTFANGISYPVGSEELRGTGYMMFYVDYSALANEKEPARPSKIASIRWSGPSGVVDGIEGDHRLTGWFLTVSETVSVDVVVRPADGGRSTVFGQAWFHDVGRDSTAYVFGYGLFLSAATTDPAGVAIATGRIPTIQTAKGLRVGSAGGVLAAGILPPGATGIGVIRTSGSNATERAGQQILPDGRVIFAITAESPDAVDPGKDSIKAVTWTKADGTRGRIAVTQKHN